KVNVTVSDGSNTLYYYENITTTTNNETNYQILNFTLIEKTDNPINLTAEPGWTGIYKGDSVTLDCTTPEGTPHLYRDGVEISIPDVSAYDEGVFDIRCEVPTETTNYKPTNVTETLTVNPILACTSNTTFIYNKTVTTSTNITTLNFTALVSNNVVRKDLGDVYVPTNVSSVGINTTDGYYFVVNNTGLSEFVVKFGNYFVQNNYSTAPTANIQDVTGYNKENIRYQIDLNSEMSGEPMHPPNATVSLTMHCSNGQNYIKLGGNKITYFFATYQHLSWIYTKVKYTAQDFYSRNWYPKETKDSYYHIFYLIDAYKRAMDKIDFIMDNPNYYDDMLQVYKTIGDKSLIITEGYFDISHLFSAYLGEDEKYYIRMLKDGKYIELGEVLITEPAEKHISPTYTPIGRVTLISDNIEGQAWFKNGSANISDIRVTYEDKLEMSANVTINVKNLKNNSILYNNTYYNTSSLDLTISGGNTSVMYYITWVIEHPKLGNSPVTKHATLSSLNKTIGFGVGSWFYPLFAFFLVFISATVVGPRNVLGGTIVIMTVLGFSFAIGWLEIGGVVSNTVIALFGIMGVLAIAKQFKSGRGEKEA
ncbi:hypothetical protein AKJ54_00635, partial [candidate division MSBL1 archaeon SCGC-AAA382K21]